MIRKELLHEGIKERSGRYPWGSGQRPYQRLEGAGRKVGSAAVKAGKGILRAVGKTVKFAVKATVIGGLTLAAGAVLSSVGLGWLNSSGTTAYISGTMFRSSLSQSDVLTTGEAWLRGALR